MQLKLIYTIVTILFAGFGFSNSKYTGSRTDLDNENEIFPTEISVTGITDNYDPDSLLIEKEFNLSNSNVIGEKIGVSIDENKEDENKNLELTIPRNDFIQSSVLDAIANDQIKESANLPTDIAPENSQITLTKNETTLKNDESSQTNTFGDEQIIANINTPTENAFSKNETTLKDNESLLKENEITFKDDEPEYRQNLALNIFSGTDSASDESDSMVTTFSPIKNSQNNDSEFYSNGKILDALSSDAEINTNGIGHTPSNSDATERISTNAQESLTSFGGNSEKDINNAQLKVSTLKSENVHDKTSRQEQDYEIHSLKKVLNSVEEPEIKASIDTENMILIVNQSDVTPATHHELKDQDEIVDLSLNLTPPVEAEIIANQHESEKDFEVIPAVLSGQPEEAPTLAKATPNVNLASITTSVQRDQSMQDAQVNNEIIEPLTVKTTSAFEDSGAISQESFTEASIVTNINAVGVTSSQDELVSSDETTLQPIQVHSYIVKNLSNTNITSQSFDNDQIERTTEYNEPFFSTNSSILNAKELPNTDGDSSLNEVDYKMDENSKDGMEGALVKDTTDHLDEEIIETLNPVPQNKEISGGKSPSKKEQEQTESQINEILVKQTSEILNIEEEVKELLKKDLDGASEKIQDQNEDIDLNNPIREQGVESATEYSQFTTVSDLFPIASIGLETSKLKNTLTESSTIEAHQKNEPGSNMAGNTAIKSEADHSKEEIIETLDSEFHNEENLNLKISSHEEFELSEQDPIESLIKISANPNKETGETLPTTLQYQKSQKLEASSKEEIETVEKEAIKGLVKQTFEILDIEKEVEALLEKELQETIEQKVIQNEEINSNESSKERTSEIQNMLHNQEDAKQVTEIVKSSDDNVKIDPLSLSLPETKILDDIIKEEGSRTNLDNENEIFVTEIPLMSIKGNYDPDSFLTEKEFKQSNSNETIEPLVVKTNAAFRDSTADIQESFTEASIVNINAFGVTNSQDELVSPDETLHPIQVHSYIDKSLSNTNVSSQSFDNDQIERTTESNELITIKSSDETSFFSTSSPILNAKELPDTDGDSPPNELDYKMDEHSKDSVEQTLVKDAKDHSNEEITETLNPLPQNKEIHNEKSPSKIEQEQTESQIFELLVKQTSELLNIEEEVKELSKEDSDDANENIQDQNEYIGLSNPIKERGFESATEYSEFATVLFSENSDLFPTAATDLESSNSRNALPESSSIEAYQKDESVSNKANNAVTKSEENHAKEEISETLVSESHNEENLNLKVSPEEKLESSEHEPIESLIKTPEKNRIDTNKEIRETLLTTPQNQKIQKLEASSKEEQEYVEKEAIKGLVKQTFEILDIEKEVEELLEKELQETIEQKETQNEEINSNESSQGRISEIQNTPLNQEDTKQITEIVKNSDDDVKMAPLSSSLPETKILDDIIKEEGLRANLENENVIFDTEISVASITDNYDPNSLLAEKEFKQSNSNEIIEPLTMKTNGVIGESTADVQESFTEAPIVTNINALRVTSSQDELVASDETSLQPIQIPSYIVKNLSDITSQSFDNDQIESATEYNEPMTIKSSGETSFLSTSSPILNAKELPNTISDSSSHDVDYKMDENSKDGIEETLIKDIKDHLNEEITETLNPLPQNKDIANEKPPSKTEQQQTQNQIIEMLVKQTSDTLNIDEETKELLKKDVDEANEKTVDQNVEIDSKNSVNDRGVESATEYSEFTTVLFSENMDLFPTASIGLESSNSRNFLTELSSIEAHQMDESVSNIADNTVIKSAAEHSKEETSETLGSKSDNFKVSSQEKLVSSEQEPIESHVKTSEKDRVDHPNEEIRETLITTLQNEKNQQLEEPSKEIQEPVDEEVKSLVKETFEILNTEKKVEELLKNELKETIEQKETQNEEISSNESSQERTSEIQNTSPNQQDTKEATETVKITDNDVKKDPLSLSLVEIKIFDDIIKEVSNADLTLTPDSSFTSSPANVADKKNSAEIFAEQVETATANIISSVTQSGFKIPVQDESNKFEGNVEESNTAEIESSSIPETFKEILIEEINHQYFSEIQERKSEIDQINTAKVMQEIPNPETVEPNKATEKDQEEKTSRLNSAILESTEANPSKILQHEPTPHSIVASQHLVNVVEVIPKTVIVEPITLEAVEKDQKERKSEVNSTILKSTETNLPKIFQIELTPGTTVASHDEKHNQEDIVPDLQPAEIESIAEAILPISKSQSNLQVIEMRSQILEKTAEKSLDEAFSNATLKDIASENSPATENIQVTDASNQKINKEIKMLEEETKYVTSPETRTIEDNNWANNKETVSSEEQIKDINLSQSTNTLQNDTLAFVLTEHKPQANSINSKASSISPVMVQSETTDSTAKISTVDNLEQHISDPISQLKLEVTPPRDIQPPDAAIEDLIEQVIETLNAPEEVEELLEREIEESFNPAPKSESQEIEEKSQENPVEQEVSNMELKQNQITNNVEVNDILISNDINSSGDIVGLQSLSAYAPVDLSDETAGGTPGHVLSLNIPVVNAKELPSEADSFIVNNEAEATTEGLVAGINHENGPNSTNYQVDIAVKNIETSDTVIKKDLISSNSNAEQEATLQEQSEIEVTHDLDSQKEAASGQNELIPGITHQRNSIFPDTSFNSTQTNEETRKNLQDLLKEESSLVQDSENKINLNTKVSGQGEIDTLIATEVKIDDDKSKATNFLSNNVTVPMEQAPAVTSVPEVKTNVTEIAEEKLSELNATKLQYFEVSTNVGLNAEIQTEIESNIPLQQITDTLITTKNISKTSPLTEELVDSASGLEKHSNTFENLSNLANPVHKTTVEINFNGFTEKFDQPNASSEEGSSETLLTLDDVPRKILTSPVSNLEELDNLKDKSSEYDSSDPTVQNIQSKIKEGNYQPHSFDISTEVDDSSSKEKVEDNSSEKIESIVRQDESAEESSSEVRYHKSQSTSTQHVSKESDALEDTTDQKSSESSLSNAAKFFLENKVEEVSGSEPFTPKATEIKISKTLDQEQAAVIFSSPEINEHALHLSEIDESPIRRIYHQPIYQGRSMLSEELIVPQSLQLAAGFVPTKVEFDSVGLETSENSSSSAQTADETAKISNRSFDDTQLNREDSTNNFMDAVVEAAELTTEMNRFIWTFHSSVAPNQEIPVSHPSSPRAAVDAKLVEPRSITTSSEPHQQVASLNLTVMIALSVTALFLLLFLLLVLGKICTQKLRRQHGTLNIECAEQQMNSYVAVPVTQEDS